MRHNVYYITYKEPSDGQAKESRSESLGVETDGQPQPSSRFGVRQAVPGESILRSEGSPPGSLRDVAPPPRRGSSIVEVATRFGVSRPTVYQAQATFQEAGLSGLSPKQRGPKERHKLSTEVIDYVRSLRAAEPGLTTVACVQAIQKKFGVTVHRRSLERALASKKKLRHPS